MLQNLMIFLAVINAAKGLRNKPDGTEVRIPDVRGIRASGVTVTLTGDGNGLKLVKE